MLIRLSYVAAVLVVVPLLIWNSFIQQLSAEWNDLILRIWGTQASPALSQVVLVAIDDRTASSYGPLPLNRARLAEGLEVLARAGPKVAVLDLLLAEAGDAVSDKRLGRAIHALPKVVLGAALESDIGGQPRWIQPLPGLAVGRVIAHVHAAPDPNGAVRSILLSKEGAGQRFWALGLEASRLAIDANAPLETSDAIFLGKTRIPAAQNDNRSMRIHYAGPEGSFPRVSFSALLDGAADLSAFRDRIVIVGVTAQGSGDRLFTPFSNYIGMSGIEIHANVIRTVLDRSFLVPLGPVGEFAVSLLLIGLCVTAILRLRGIRLLLTFLGIGVLIVAAGFASIPAGYILPLASFLAVCLVASSIAGVSEYVLLSKALAGETEKRKEYSFRVQAIAHEIKTPLTAIQGSSEMMSEGLVPEDQRARMAGLIYRESKRLTGLIQTFLNVERLASGSLNLEKQEVNLRGLCAGIIERGQLYAARKQIRVDSVIPDIRLAADPDLLSFAIYNLITNGVKYSPKQTTILVSAAEDGSKVTITVSDEGYGIAPADQEKIFQKFYRLKRDEKSAEEGSGIGLALAKEIIQQHGGLISVTSQPNEGSRFTITLPKR